MSHIKLHGVKPRIQYVANGTLKEYEFPFVIFEKTNIKVYLDDVEQNDTTYTVCGIKNSNGGCITFNTAPENNVIISIVRDLSIERTTDFQEGATLRANELNDELDYQIACLQQVAENLNRSMVLPPYAADSTLDLTLPTPSAGKAIVWNSDGTNLENSTVRVNDLESTLRSYKESAKADAETASEKADIASEQAQIATQKADEAKETLNAKANKDMDNLSTAGKSVVANLGKPSDTCILETLGSANTTNTYTAPADGYLCFGGNSGGGTGGADISIYDSASGLCTAGSTYQNGHTVALIYPIRKNKTINYFYVNFTNPYLKFIYAQGEV